MSKTNSFAILLLIIAGLLAWPLITTKWPAAQALLTPVTAMLPGPIGQNAPDDRVIGGPIRVVDGDTVDAGGARYRLVGFDTPERGDLAKCDSERALAARATARMEEMVSAGARLARTGCACKPGTEGTKRCNHGRLCGVLTIDGRDAGNILVEEGLAHRYVCNGDRCPRRPGWC
jgi:endonuclease YncB( thermonuclease family)